MSNNNHPHGHLSQPAQNPSWNPLQIPSYIPRQPQLAHMSNERTMVRSPLAWHSTAQPPDAIYNFMSANHKNLEHHQMNPLLAPPYVSGTLPFDSMDLSLQSSRSAPSPLNKSGLPQQTPQQSHGPPQQQQHQQQQQHLHAANSFPAIHNLSASVPSGAHHPQQHVSAMSASQHPHNVHQSPAHAPPPPMSPAAASNKYLNANGSDCESLLPPTSVAASTNNDTGANYMQSNREENFNKISQLKRIYDNESKSSQKPVELVSKDCNYLTGLSNKLPTHSLHQQVSSKKNSPLRNYPQQQQHHHHPHQQLQPYSIPPPPTNVKYNGPQTPPTPHSPIMQQGPLPSIPTQHQMQSPSGTGSHVPPMDYNQLHLQHHMHSTQHALNYVQQHLSHHQTQQETPQQSPHLHYGAPQHHHSQHIPQQQQTHQQQMQQHFNQHQHPQQQHLHSRNSSNTPQLTNLDALPKPTASKQDETKDDEQPIITDLSTTPSAYKNTVQQPPPSTPDVERNSSLPDAPESPFTATSNEESLESNSNSSSSRIRRKRKSSQVMRLTPNEKILVGHTEQQQQQHSHITNRCSNSHSPKLSPAERKSPKSIECSNFSMNLATPASNHEKESREPTQYTQENGCVDILPTHPSSPGSPKVVNNNAVEMAPKTSNENSNSSSTYPDGCGSPKTKKQRQALLQRNIPEIQPQITNESSEPCEKLDMEITPESHTHTCTKLPAPPSPQSISSSSSASSSSAGTHTSHSSNDNRRLRKPNNVAETDTPISPALQQKNTLPMENAECHKIEEIKDESPVDVSQKSVNENQSPVKVHNFEEVENKLEEMFAGIEDESSVQENEPEVPSATQPSTRSATEDDLSLTLELDPALKQKESIAPKPNLAVKEHQHIEENAVPVEVRMERPLTTKAAMKSTMPSPQHKSTEIKITETEVQMTMHPQNQDSLLAPETQIIMASSPIQNKRQIPRRRLSVGMDPEFLRVSMEIQDISEKKSPVARKNQKKVNCQLVGNFDDDDDKPSTSAAAAAALAAREKEEREAMKVATANELAVEKQPIVAVEKAAVSASNAKKKNVAKGKKAKTGAGGGKGGGKKGVKNSKQQKQRRKMQTSDEESTAAPIKESTNVTESKHKSPFILVKGDGSVSVINSHSVDDVTEKQAKVKKPANYARDRKNIRGMHSSTLSNKYDADTTDSTWICVFCKRGPHRMGLGDLFGPYLVSTECDEYRAAINAPGAQDWNAIFENKRKRSDMVQVRERNLPVVPATLASMQLSLLSPKAMHKRKRKLTEEPPPIGCAGADDYTDPLDYTVENIMVETFRGMCKTSNNSYEIWLHEDCAIWAPSVFLVGVRIVGLDAAVWDSMRYHCVICSQAGGIVCCLQRDCKAVAHVPCAREANWCLNESEANVYCQQHAPPSANLTPSTNQQLTLSTTVLS